MAVAPLLSRISNKTCRPGPRAGAQSHRVKRRIRIRATATTRGAAGKRFQGCGIPVPISGRTARRAPLDPGSGAGVTCFLILTRYREKIFLHASPGRPEFLREIRASPSPKDCSAKSRTAGSAAPVFQQYSFFSILFLDTARPAPYIGPVNARSAPAAAGRRPLKKKRTKKQAGSYPLSGPPPPIGHRIRHPMRHPVRHPMRQGT